jgi:hypothetical protein
MDPGFLLAAMLHRLGERAGCDHGLWAKQSLSMRCDSRQSSSAGSAQGVAVLS